MPHARRVVFLFVALAVIAPAHRLEGQIGGLIKKKVAERVKGGDKTDQPAASQDAANGGSKLPMKLTENVLTAFEKGLEVERDHRQATVKRLASLKTPEEYNACQQTASASPEALKIIMAPASLPENAPLDQVQKAVAKSHADVAKLVTDKCGERPDPSREAAWRAQQMQAAEAAGVKAFAAGMGAAPGGSAGPFLAGEHEQDLQRETDFYRLLKEWVPPFCKLPKDAQQAAASNGVSVPGAGRSNAFVYTADEARLLMPQCEELMALLSVLQ